MFTIIKNNIDKTHYIIVFQLLDRYDKGVLLDEESWYSITPQVKLYLKILT